MGRAASDGGASLAAEHHLRPAPPPFVDALGGVLAGVMQVAVGQPMDSVKVRMQTAHGTTTMGALRDLLREGGARSLYRGATAALPGLVVDNVVLFGVYGALRAACPPSLGDGASSFLAGGGAGVFSGLVLCPTELIKTRLQTAPAPAVGVPPPTALTIVRSIVATQGPAGLFRGLGPTLWRDVPGTGVYFGAYELLGQALARGDTPAGATPAAAALGAAVDASVVVLSGGLAGVAYWLSVFPADVVKTRAQAATGTGGGRLGMLAALRAVAAEGGVRGLYAGLTPVLARAFPANAAAFAGWGIVKEGWHALHPAGM